MRKAPASLLFTLAMFVVVIVAASIPTNAQTFSVLYNFGTNPDDPIDVGERPGLVAQGRDGNMYSTSYGGGASSQGTVFKITPTGTLTVIYSFDGTHGSNPYSGLTLGTDGNFYGTTSGGGTFLNGIVFKITPSGTLTVLYNFAGNDGAKPLAPPIQAIDGSFYGTTQMGGAGGIGTVYKLTPAGAFTSLHQFTNSDGAYPYPNLIQATDGDFYGTAYEGGTGNGTVFKITPSGTFKLLHNFVATDGGLPIGGLVQASNGNFYGTTAGGGTAGAGVIFKMTLAGAFTVIHNFSGSDGDYPATSLVQATDGNVYGNSSITPTIFRISPSGSGFFLLYNFTTMDGAPASALHLHTNGILYGDTFNGGSHSDGEFYSFNENLRAFVSLVSTSGKAGKSIGILGQGFTGTTAVSFNGTSATFTVSSKTYLTATVPSGATTGSVTVTTPSGKLTSSQNFRVTPVILSFNPTSGSVGTSVVITGTSLLQASKVTFGGIGATAFTVNSDTQVTATVPTGAKTGKIAITTPGGTAQSAASFTVTP